MTMKAGLIRLSCSVLFASFVVSQSTSATEINEKRATFNFQMFCLGCHTPDGVGGNGVPKFKGFIGHFLKTQTGREYLVRVPGSANSAMNNSELAEVLNWTINKFAEESAPKTWPAYTAEEVGEYRQDPLMEVFEYRKQLIKDILGAD